MAAALATARSTLLAWYAAGRRDLPWRAARADPYAVWVSEIMLQQTQVATALPYYQRWMARFPDVASLAAAPLDDVLSAWQGLGYYARARNLHAAARAVVAEHGGRLPATAAALRALPGIGEYTAAAVASIAFGEPVAAVDGNIERVMARWHGIADDVGRAAGRRAVRAAAARWVVGPAPGDVNQALMELGATVCTPRGPRCGECPIAPGCAARLGGRPEGLPVKARPAAARHAAAVALVVRDRDGRWLVARRPARGLLGGLWEFPLAHVAMMLDGAPGETPDLAAAAAMARARLGLAVTARAVLPAVEHAFSHRRLSVVPVLYDRCDPYDLYDPCDPSAPDHPAPRVAEPPAAFWLPDAPAGDAAYDALAWLDDAELAARPMSTLMRRLLAARDEAADRDGALGG